MGGRLRLAGTLEISPLDAPPMPRRLAMLADGARAYLRGIDESRASEHWSGWRPCLADGMPAIGWVPGVEGLMLATGHAMLGMTLGPVTGELVADLIDERRPSIDLSMVDPARLAAAVAGS
jgi:D-amino-acid dehydrogenase